jgi:hypothetical protein
MWLKTGKPESAGSVAVRVGVVAPVGGVDVLGTDVGLMVVDAKVGPRVAEAGVVGTVVRVTHATSAVSVIKLKTASSDRVKKVLRL